MRKLTLQLVDNEEVNCRLFISTLDYSSVFSSLGMSDPGHDTKENFVSKTKSQRTIMWIPLNPLVNSELLDFFINAFNFINKKWIEYFFSLCNGHPRTLEALYFALGNSQLFNNEFEQIFLGFIEQLKERNLVEDVVDDYTQVVLAQSILSEEIELKLFNS